MAEAPQVVETDPDFEPLPRQRSCTWPLPRPEFNQSNSTTSSPAPSGGAATNPDATATLASASAVSTDFMSNLSLLEESEDFPRAPGCVAVAAAAAASRGLCGDFQGPEAGCVHPAPPQQPPPTGPLAQPPPVPPAAAGPLAGQPRKSSSSRRNAWGNLSYADLITKAIESSAEKRLTLSQIYEWMVKSVPYFKDKGDSNSSAGWKNSIRHNLSLHNLAAETLSCTGCLPSVCRLCAPADKDGATGNHHNDVPNSLHRVIAEKTFRSWRAFKFCIYAVDTELYLCVCVCF